MVELPKVEADYHSLKAETYLRILLCFCGIGCALAVVPLFMPRSWIYSIHEWLGLGGFPSQPIAFKGCPLLFRNYPLPDFCHNAAIVVISFHGNVRRYAFVLVDHRCGFCLACLHGQFMVAEIRENLLKTITC
jgi:hypothetical protein